MVIVPRRRWRSVAVLLAALAGGPPAQAGPVDELRALTTARFEANAKNDRAFYERLLAANFTFLEPFGRAMGRSAYLEYEFGSRPAGYVGAHVTISGFEAAIDGDTAVTSYRVVEPTELAGVRFESRQHRLDSYARRGGAWQLVTMAVALEKSWPRAARVDPRLYAEYAGSYRLSPRHVVVVTVEGGRLMAQMTGQAKSELVPESETTFFDTSDSPLARTVFERDASGRVVSQVYRAQGQELRAVKEP